MFPRLNHRCQPQYPNRAYGAREGVFTMTQTARTLNTVVFTGNLGKDPDMSYTSGGSALTKFSIAVWQGQRKDDMWLNIVCWQDLAVQVEKEVNKGDEVEVKGRLTQRKW